MRPVSGNLRPRILRWIAPLVLVLGGCSARPPASALGDSTIGEASWYGLEERGRLTANGEAMDPEAMTAAHRTLPFGSLVKVTDLDTGHSVEVRINDRGPFIRGRIIDLSHRAARDLGILRRGVARVMLTYLELGEEPTWSVQAGAYRLASAARKQADRLRGAGYRNAVVQEHGNLHRVRIGPFEDKEEAARLAAQLRSRGHEAMVIQIRL